MNESSAFDGLRQFLFDHVASYDELEVLLLLQRQTERHWSAAAAAEQLGLPIATCLTALENLAAQGLLVHHGNPASFRFAPGSKDLALGTEQVQRAYRSSKIAIIRIMTTNAMARVRARALRRLEEALQVRDSKKLP